MIILKSYLINHPPAWTSSKRSRAGKSITLLILLIMALGFIVGPETHAAAPTNGLISYWKFDEGGGTTASDSAGSNTGILTNGPTWVAGKLGQALNFDGIDDKVSISDHPTLRPSNITVSYWIYPINLATGLAQDIIAKRPSMNNGGFVFEATGSAAVNHYVNIGGTWNWVAMTYTNNIWQHITVTYDGTTLIGYINGTQAASTGATGSITHITPATLVLGSDSPESSNSRYFNGSLDDLRIYSRALSAAEILDVYNDLGGTSPPPPPPPPADTTPPSVSISSPAGGSTVSGTVTVSATA